MAHVIAESGLAERYEQRVARCADLIRMAGWDAILLTRSASRRYLTGDARPVGFVIVDSDGKVFIGVPHTDVVDAYAQARFDQLIAFDDYAGFADTADSVLRHTTNRGVIGIEKADLLHPAIRLLTHQLRTAGLPQLRDTQPLLARLRLVKDATEIECIASAAQNADIGLAGAVDVLRPEVSELQVAAEAEYVMRQTGAEGFWPTAVASGPRSRLSFGAPTQRRLEAGDLVTVMVRPIISGYTAVVRRTFAIGPPDPTSATAYEAYCHAQEAAIDRIRPGSRAHDIVGNTNGDRMFGPPIHGIGLDFEEAPWPAGQAPASTAQGLVLEANMVIAVGTGLHLDTSGIAITDTVVVTTDGPRVLTHYPRRLHI